MLKRRIIPVLTWDGRNTVLQTVKFGRPARKFGSLMDAMNVYENRTIDELVLIDIEARREGRGPNIEAVKHFTSRVFCPITVGGGIRNNDDIRDMLNAGADKVVLGKVSFRFTRDAALKFGSQCIVYALDAPPGWIRRDANSTARVAERAGLAGEVLLTAIARNGTLVGYDLDLIRAVTQAVGIPVIAHGGCGGPAHMVDALAAGAHAVAASTLFLFTEHTPRTCAKFLAENGVAVRIE